MAPLAHAVPLVPGRDMSDLELLRFVSPEARLLLASCDPDPAGVRTTAGAPLDWGLLILLAERERATNVLWSRLAAAGISVPDQVAETLRRLSMLSQFESLRMEEKAIAFIAALSERGIDVVLLKGAALAQAVYRGFVDRPMGDVDLLVDAARAREAWQQAQHMGWRWDAEAFPATRYTGHHHLPPLVDDLGGRFGLEIHSAGNIEGHPFALSFQDVLANARPVSVGRGVTAWMLDETHQVVHLSVHCAWAHQMKVGAWRTFRDLHALVASGRVDWERLVVVAREQHAMSSCYWVLRLGRALTRLDVPPGILEALSERVPKFLRGPTARHLVAQLFPIGDLCPSEGLHRAIWSLALNPSGQGIGRVRPWDADEPASREEPRHRATFASRTMRQFASVRSWWRYLRVLATPT